MGSFSDGARDIGPDAHRHGRDALLAGLARAEFDVVVAPDLPALARSINEVCTVMGTAASVGARVLTLDGLLGHGSPEEEALLVALPLVRRMDSAIIANRVIAGHSAARAAGRHVGRPPVPQHLREEVERYLDGGYGVRETSRRVGLAVGTVSAVRKSQRQDMVE